MINTEIIKKLDTLKFNYGEDPPFPHIVIDNFLTPYILELILSEVKNYNSWVYDINGQKENVQVNKFFSPSSKQSTLIQSLNQMKQEVPLTYKVLEYLYSKEALDFISKLTGIENLEGDSTWLGGGIHKVINGGKLSIHADFNKNWITNLYRRVNLLIYLNKDWKPSYGGDLELWNSTLTICYKKIAPIFNRAVIFTTSKDSYHGHPHPMVLPEGVARYSLALYYFTKECPPNEESEMRFVQWKN